MIVNRNLSFRILFFAGMSLLFSCTSHQSSIRQNRPSSSYRLLYDNDGSDLLLNNWWRNRPLTIADLDSCVDMIANSQVTTYMMCTGCDIVYYRSKYGRILGDDSNGTKGIEGNPATYQRFHQAYLNLEMLEKNGTDLIKETLQRAKQHKLETFLTYRVNDLHFTDTTMHAPMFYADWWYEHPQFWTHDATQGWHSFGALDFAHKEVRQHKMDLITEQLDKYGCLIDGYVLDFMRFFVYFKSGEGCNHIEDMTQFVRDIRKKVEETATRNHKKIILGVRVAPTLQDNLRNGLDVRQWLKEGLIDFLATGIHIRINPSLPTADLRKELGKDLNVPLYVSSDATAYAQNEPPSEGMLRGFFSHNLSQGADGIYLFNYYFGDYNGKYYGKRPLEPGGQVCRISMPQMLKEVGALKTLEGRNKIYWLSDGRPEYGIKPKTPLPLTLQSNESKSVKIYVGDQMKPKRPEEVILFFRTDKPASINICINNQAAIKNMPSYTTLYDRERGMEGTEKEYAIILPTKALEHGNNEITFTSTEGVDIHVKRIELALKYGDVKTNGYF